MRTLSALFLPLRSLRRVFFLAAPLAVLLAIGAAAFFGLLTVEQETPETSEASHISQVPEIPVATPPPPEVVKKEYQSATLPPLLPAPAQLPPLVTEKPERFRVAALPKNFDAFAINNKGEVGGMSGKNATIWMRGRMRAWESDAPKNPRVSLAAVCLSDASVLGGMRRETMEGAGGTGVYTDVSLWNKTKSAADTVPTLPNLSSAFLYGLNARKQAVGVCEPGYMTEWRGDGRLPDGSAAFEYSNGFYWDGKVTRDLGRGAAFGINERNQVIGAQNGRIILWQGREKRDLGDGVGYAINNRGDILANPSANIKYSPSRVHEPDKRSLPQATLLHNNTQTCLGVLPGYKGGLAKSLNDRNEIVGSCSPEVTVGDVYNDVYNDEYYRDVVMQQHAFLWRAGTMYDLNALLPKHSGWVLHDARSINNKGQIVGRGTFHGKIRSFLLTPR